jgi:transcriptional regulator with XRE-family HTH domain
MESFGETIKNMREEKNLPLRKVAAYLDIDQATLSKFEHGTRMPKRDQVIQLATYFKADKKKLLVKWLAQKVVYEVEDDDLALEAMVVAEENLRYIKGAK